MIIIQTSRVFVVPEAVKVTPVKNIPIEAKIERKKEQPIYTKKSVPKLSGRIFNFILLPTNNKHNVLL